MSSLFASASAPVVFTHNKEVRRPRGQVSKLCVCTMDESRTSRRRIATLTSVTLFGICIRSETAHAYGGTKQIREFDGGSGNPRYDELMKALEKKGQSKTDITVPAEKDSVTRKCLTGKEPACY